MTPPAAHIKRNLAPLSFADVPRQIYTEAILGVYELKRIDPGDRERFAEVVEAELIGLHEGNFARYRIRPSEFAAWRRVWDAR
jgi:hypothetical protein